MMGIANDKADDPGCFTTRFFAHNRAMIQLHKEHHASLAQALLNCAFQLSKRACFTS
jgi:hypothetical protein